MDKEVKQYRNLVLVHLDYIKEKVDHNAEQLKAINGRLRTAENSIWWLKGIGSTLAFIFTIAMGYFYKD